MLQISNEAFLNIACTKPSLRVSLLDSWWCSISPGSLDNLLLRNASLRGIPSELQFLVSVKSGRNSLSTKFGRSSFTYSVDHSSTVNWTTSTAKYSTKGLQLPYIKQSCEKALPRLELKNYLSDYWKPATGWTKEVIPICSFRSFRRISIFTQKCCSESSWPIHLQCSSLQSLSTAPSAKLDPPSIACNRGSQTESKYEGLIQQIVHFLYSGLMVSCPSLNLFHICWRKLVVIEWTTEAQQTLWLVR